MTVEAHSSTPVLDRPIEELGLTARATNALKNAGVETIGALQDKTWPEIKDMKNLGKKSAAEIEALMDKLGLAFKVVIDATATTDLAQGQTPPDETAEIALDPAELDRRLCETATRISLNMLDLCALAAPAIRQKIWEGFGYIDPQAYFETRVGVSYRTVMRWVQVHEALQAVPEGEAREAVRERLAALGIMKAAALAPIIERKEDLEPWLKRAEKSTVDALQEAVSHHVGAKPRGPVANEPGARFYRGLMNQIPPDEQGEVREVFEAGMEVLETKNPIVVFIHMIQEVKVEWMALLEKKRAGQPV